MSEACAAFAPLVRSIACRTGAHLTLLNTLELPSSYESYAIALTNWIDIRSMMREQRDQFTAFHKERFAGLPGVNHVYRRGDPAQHILEYAKKHQIDLIMIPTGGVGTLRRMLIGSITAKVLHDADCPVWTTAHSPQQPFTERLSRILCAINFDEENQTLIQYANALASTFGAQLRFLNVVDVGESWATRHFEGEFVARLASEARQHFNTLLEPNEQQAEIAVRSGDIAHSVRREAVEWNADLVVIGRGVLAEPLGRLRSETYKIIRESACSVVSVVGA